MKMNTDPHHEHESVIASPVQDRPNDGRMERPLPSPAQRSPSATAATAESTLQGVRTAIAGQPAIAVAIAVSFGAAAGWLIKRRSY